MTFSEEGHIDIGPKDLLATARLDPRVLVNDILLSGTPRVFKNYQDYCGFRRTLAERLHVHPCSIIVRGSARLGYSTAPFMNKAWRLFSSKSDIDVAIADVDYFNRFVLLATGSPNISTNIACVSSSNRAIAARRLARNDSARSSMSAIRRCSGKGGRGIFISRKSRSVTFGRVIPNVMPAI
jgi:hypothetical protein